MASRAMHADDLLPVDARTDGQLVDQASRGDATAFGELYRRHAHAAWRVAIAVTRKGDDAADAVSEAFAKVFEALPKRRLEGGAPFRPYLLAATRNAAIDVLRRAGRVDPTDDADLTRLPTAVVGPAERVTVAEDSEFVAQAFSDLPERWRSVLWLTEVEGMPPREAAPLLGLTANGTAQLAVRARAGLRERYLQAHLRSVPREECRYTIERLGAYVGGGLAAREVAKVDQHLAGCRVCTARRDELEDLGSTLRRVVVPLPLALGAVALHRWQATLAASHKAAGAAFAHGRITRAERALAGAAAGVLAIGVATLGARLHDRGHERVRTHVAAPPAPPEVRVINPTAKVETPPPPPADSAIEQPRAAGETLPAPATPAPAPLSAPAPQAPAPTPQAPAPAPHKPAPSTPPAQPVAQASAAVSGASAGSTVGVAVGLGDHSCTGVALGGTAIGCAPTSGQPVIDVSTAGQALPAVHLHLP